MLLMLFFALYINCIVFLSLLYLQRLDITMLLVSVYTTDIPYLELIILILLPTSGGDPQVLFLRTPVGLVFEPLHVLQPCPTAWPLVTFWRNSFLSKFIGWCFFVFFPAILASASLPKLHWHLPAWHFGCMLCPVVGPLLLLHR